jgi:guanylate kinase
MNGPIKEREVSGSDYYFDTGYRKGYFKALLDINNFFDNYSEMIKYHRLNNSKRIKQVLQAILEGREFMLEYGADVDFILVRDKANQHTIKDIFIDAYKRQI